MFSLFPFRVRQLVLVAPRYPALSEYHWEGRLRVPRAGGQGFL